MQPLICSFCDTLLNASTQSVVLVPQCTECISSALFFSVPRISGTSAAAKTIRAVRQRRRIHVFATPGLALICGICSRRASAPPIQSPKEGGRRP